MSVHITIHDVPVKVREKLARQAAARGQSMQAYLRHELERLAREPTVESVELAEPMEQVLERIRQRKADSGKHIDPEDILAERDKDRR